jgi:hypothetical protein
MGDTLRGLSDYSLPKRFNAPLFNRLLTSPADSLAAEDAMFSLLDNPAALIPSSHVPQ